MSDVQKKIADKYQEFFNFMSNEHKLILTIEEMDEVLFVAEKLIEKLNDVDKSETKTDKVLKCPKCKNHTLINYINAKQCSLCGYVC